MNQKMTANGWFLNDPVNLGFNVFTGVTRRGKCRIKATQQSGQQQCKKGMMVLA